MRTAPVDPAGRDLHRAWWSLALYPVSLAAAFVVGEGLATLLAGDEAGPTGWRLLAAALPAFVVFLVPGGLAAWWGLRARRRGCPAGRVPAALGLGLGVLFVALNATAYLLG